MTRPARWPDGRVPVLLSAHAADLLGQDARALLGHLDRHPDLDVEAVAGQLATTRRIRRHRAVIRAGDRAELADGLRAVADGADHLLVAHSDAGAAVRTAFVFPGQGTQWPSMGADAYRDLPDYRAAADACGAAFLAAGAPSPLRYLTTGVAADTFTETEIEGAQFVHAVALAAVWRAHGVLPDLTVGHSLGEIGAAYLAGTVSLADAVAVVIARAGVVERLPGRYAVAVLGLDADAAHEVIAQTPGWLELSVVNAPSSVAVSGDRDAVRAAVDMVRGRGRFAREITVGFPVHTSILEPLREDLLRRLPTSVFADSSIQFIGAATGDVVAAGTAFADHWYGNLRHTVRFDRAVATALRCGATTFVELSAHPSLAFAMGDLLGDTAATLVGSGRRDQPIAETLPAQLAVAAVADPHYDWRPAASTPMLTGFPNAPMRATPMWAVREPLPEIAAVTVTEEIWQRVEPVRPPMSPRRVAVRELGAPGPLGALVRAAVAGHPGVLPAGADDAEITVMVASPPDDDDPDAAVAHLVALVGQGVLRYPAVTGTRCRELWLVTTGAEQVHPGDAVSWAATALAAMHRSLAREYPDVAFHHLDLPTGAESAAPVLDALLTAGGELAARGAALYGRGWREAPAAPALSPADGLLDDVVITGGAGALGGHFARHVAERGARRIVLLSRRSVATDVVTALASRGAEVACVPCDITDRDALAAAAARYAGAGASLLIHAAGAAAFATGDHLDAAAAAHTLSAKVLGLTRMTELWPLRREARIVLCSSVSGLWGGHGHAAYAAANRMLDVTASRLRAQGRRCVSVRWGLWQAGTSGIVDAAETARIERSGLRPMPVDAAIEAGLRGHTGDPLIFAADTQRLSVFLDTPARPQRADAPADTPADTEGVVRAELAAVLSLADPGAVDLDTSLFDLGVDSLLALDLRKRFTRGLGRTVPLATLLGGITGTELVAQLDQKVNAPQ